MARPNAGRRFGLAMSQRGDAFDQFMKGVERASAAAGRAEALEAYAAHFRRAREALLARAAARTDEVTGEKPRPS